MTHFPMVYLIYTYLHVYSLPGHIQLEKSLSLLMIERCSLVPNFVMLSRFVVRNTCRQDIEIPRFQKHVRSDLGLFESFINTDTFPEQICLLNLESSRIAHAYKEQILQGT